MLSAACVAATGDVVEAKTGVAFSATRTEGDSTLCCTGVSYLSKFLIKIYAVAHYGAAEAMPGPEDDTEARWKHWRESRAAKAIVIRFVYGIGGKRMVRAQQQSLAEQGYDGPNRETHAEAFNREAGPGTEIRVAAAGEDELVLYWDGEEAGRWNDRPLVNAVWNAWMNQESQANAPADLVSRAEPCEEE